MAALALSLVVITVAAGFRSIVLAQHPFHLQDWVISYAAGFVRRGLTGELVDGLSVLSGVGPSEIVWVLQSCAYVAFVHGVAVLVLRGRRTWAVVLMAVSPALVLFHLHDTAGGYRKEILGLALLAQVLARFDATASDHRRFRLLVLGLAATPALVLAHELNLVVAPVLLSLTGELHRDPRRRVVIAVCASAILGAGMATVLYSGSAAQEAGICAHLEATLPSSPYLDVCGEAGAVSWLSVTGPEAFDAVVDYAGRHADGLLLVLPLVALGLYPLAREARLVSTDARWRWSMAGVGVALGVLLVASAVALDWGRLIHVGAMVAALQFLRLRVAGDGGEPWPAPSWSWVPWIAPAYGLLWNLNHANDLVGRGVLRLVSGT